MALVVIASLFAYIPAMKAGFVWDDDDWVTDGVASQDVEGLVKIWLEPDSVVQYYPLTYTSWWVDNHLWKLNPFPYHLENILLHTISAIFILLILRQLSLPGAWLAAAIFALHPVHVESVAWVTERKNTLSTMFYLASLMTYLHYALVPKNEAGSGERRKLYIASLILFLCALLSKTVTCSLPAVLLLILWWKRESINWVDIRSLIPFFMLGIILGLFTVWIEIHDVGAVGEEWSLSLIDRFLVAGRALWFYVGKLLWPLQIMFIYPRWQIDASMWQQYLYPLGAAVVMAVLWFARGKIGKGPLVAVLCFAGTLFPALGFFDVYFTRYSFVQDHFQYLASIALIVLTAAVICRIISRFAKWANNVAMIVLVFILIALGTLTWQQSRIYENVETLWRDTLKKNPN
ncbi:MAG: O-GlcNAc transferase, partial [Planctomycetes bacterium]|nr:O-GlcNAc transferase [Planctomycetota bacterium]